MIRMIQSTSADHAKSYFRNSLEKADYYINDQELQGRFGGKLAERLGLSQNVTKDQYNALCDNKHPTTSRPLTPRTKNNRTCAYDINFHCPKSLSVMHALSKDNHILEAFEKSVGETMLEIEADMKTRQRKNGADHDIDTGEIVYASFVHQTARPEGNNTPDPHLHCHNVVMNMTFDKDENRYKAGQFRDINANMPLYQAKFHKRLADKMVELGYTVRPTKNSFEIEGVPQQVINMFSKRTDEIGRVAKEKGITDAKELDKLGAKTRSKKQKGLSMAELKADWKRQIQDLSKDLPEETKQMAVRHAPQKTKEASSPLPYIEYSLEHHFERASVVPENKLLATACRHALGDTNISVDAITKQLKKDNRIIRVKDKFRTMCTTKEVLFEEKHMVELAKQSRNKFMPLYEVAPELDLKDQQASAARHVLTTSNGISIIRGGAGTGKTTLMKSVAQAITDAGKEVIVVAPTAQASRGVLAKEGFAQAETVAKLLVDKKMQEQLKDQVLMVDEAGLLGIKDTINLMELSAKQNARLLFVGDTRQHSSVVRGDALRILSTVGKIHAAEVTQIHRQKNENYKQAVEALSKGHIARGFAKLDQMECIKDAQPYELNCILADDYINALKQGETALVISPTHKQGELVTDEIRNRMRAENMLGKKEINVRRLVNRNMTDAQKTDHRNYSEGEIIQFHQNVKGASRGSQWKVHSIKDGKINIADKEGKLLELPKDKASKYSIFSEEKIALSKGDKVVITMNGFDKSKANPFKGKATKGKRLDNGMALEVASVSHSGKILLKSGDKTRYTIDQDFGHITHGHCVTSHSSQGKTVDTVFIAQPAATFGATDAKQFYVSVSRGRQRVQIYTNDKELLLLHASELGDRQSAIELVSSNEKHTAQVERQLRIDHQRSTQKENIRDMIKDDRQTGREYEPEI